MAFSNCHFHDCVRSGAQNLKYFGWYFAQLILTTADVLLITFSCAELLQTPSSLTNRLCRSAWEHESEASPFDLNMKSYRLIFTPHSKPRSIISVKTPIISQNSSTFVPDANVHLVQEQMALTRSTVRPQNSLARG